MGKLKMNITMTLDGYIAGPNQSLDHPMGEGAEGLHSWVFGLKTFREMHGMEGGDTGPDDDILREHFAGIGATIMGRNMFGGYPGPWQGDAWKGWWGENPPFHHPVFVVTHHARSPLVMQGGTTFHFVTDGIESALRQAQAAAGDKDIAIGGGANVAQQFLAARLLDELQINLVPQIFGAGERLLAGLGPDLKLEPLQTQAGNGVTHLKYRLVR